MGSQKVKYMMHSVLDGKYTNYVCREYNQSVANQVL